MHHIHLNSASHHQSTNPKYYGKKNKKLRDPKPDTKHDMKSDCSEKDRIKCTLCNENYTEISMPCAGMHSYCFNCVNKWMVSKKELTCPECRKECENFIKLPIPKEKISKEFNEFLESVKIIPNPLRTTMIVNVFKHFLTILCIYPTWTLIHFREQKPIRTLLRQY